MYDEFLLLSALPAPVCTLKDQYFSERTLVYLPLTRETESTNPSSMVIAVHITIENLEIRQALSILNSTEMRQNPRGEIYYYGQVLICM